MSHELCDKYFEMYENMVVGRVKTVETVVLTAYAQVMNLSRFTFEMGVQLQRIERVTRSKQWRET